MSDIRRRITACPAPIFEHERVLLAHGGGGRLTQRLLAEVIHPAWDHESIVSGADGATLSIGAGRMAMSTDSFVVDPLFFPGGDIGTLAICGTVNDLAMCGARPKWLTVGFILEEGLPFETLKCVVASMRRLATEAGVTVVSGDTKVVERGKADGLYINTSGVGIFEHDHEVGPREVRAGDRVLLSGDMGRHGVAIMAAREGLGLNLALESDCAPVAEAALALFERGAVPHCLRDATRGGVGAVCHEIATASGLGVRLDEARLPVHPAVSGMCELLGLDPLHVACEGRFVAFVPPARADAALDVMRGAPGGEAAALIGEVVDAPIAPVVIRTALGTERIVDLPSGSQLPRIC